MWVLASASPRRHELLQLGKAQFIIDPSRYEEDNRGDSIAQLVICQALGKAREVYQRRNDQMAVLGADTLVSLHHQVLGKPIDREDALKMLQSLSGEVHEVWTGLALVTNAGVWTRAIMTKVRFRHIMPIEIEYYLDSNEWCDKAGAYGIQGEAAIFVDSIEGSYTNVVGLPLSQVRELFRESGVSWDDDDSRDGRKRETT